MAKRGVEAATSSTSSRSPSSSDMIKCILLGDSGVGKTCLLRAFMEMGDMENKATVGVEMADKVVDMEDGAQLRVQIWDTAGQERYRAITKSHFRRAHCCLLVYDITRQDSLTNAKMWLRELRASCSSDVVVVLVGNKIDLNAMREVGYTVGVRFAKENKLTSAANGKELFRETSALDRSTVTNAFMRVFRELTAQRSAKAAADAYGERPTAFGVGQDLNTGGSAKDVARGGCC